MDSPHDVPFKPRQSMGAAYLFDTASIAAFGADRERE
jgi:hypothetical protein